METIYSISKSQRVTEELNFIPKPKAFGLDFSGITSTDPDAELFIQTASLADSQHIYALRFLTRQLKKYNLWSKHVAVYPMIGANAFAHKLNLIDQVTTAWRWVFNGTWVHTITGAKPNTAATSNATNSRTPSGTLTLNDTHISYYSGTQIVEAGLPMGVVGFTGNRVFQMYMNYTNLGAGIEMYDQTAGSGRILTKEVGADSTGLLTGSRINGNDLRLFKNGKQIGTTATTNNASWVLPASVYEINGSNGDTNHSNLECRFVSIGAGLTWEQEYLRYQIIQRYQQILGRAA